MSIIELCFHFQSVRAKLSTNSISTIVLCISLLRYNTLASARSLSHSFYTHLLSLSFKYISFTPTHPAVILFLTSSPYDIVQPTFCCEVVDCCGATAAAAVLSCLVNKKGIYGYFILCCFNLLLVCWKLLNTAKSCVVLLHAALGCYKMFCLLLIAFCCFKLLKTVANLSIFRQLLCAAACCFLMQKAL